MFKEICLTLILSLIVAFSQAQQSNLDPTDSLVNHQKHYIIRFDVTNGNIYLPLKKKILETRNKKNYFKLLPFAYYKDSINKIYKIVQTFESGDLNSKPKVDTIYSHVINQNEAELKYIKSGRFYKPKVGSFIRLIFDNVPSGSDIGVVAEFYDKNLENASAAQGYLNTFDKAVDSAVNREVVKLTNSIKIEENKIIQKEVDSLKKINKNEIQPQVQEIISESNSVLSSVKILLTSQTTNKEELNSIITKIESYKKEFEIFNDSINIDSILRAGFFNKIKDAEKEILTLVNTLDDKNKNQIKIKEAETKISPALKIIEAKTIELSKMQENSEREIDSLSLRLTFLMDSIKNKKTIYIQPIQVPNNDISLLKITYKSDDVNKNVLREIMLKNKHGFKMDFSTGFIGTGLMDENHRIEPRQKVNSTDADSLFIIEDTKGDFAIGFALLAHAYIRSGERTNVAINSGLMLNGSNQTINYLLGGSLMLGLEQRFIISGGLSYGKIKKLSSGFINSKNYSTNQLSISSGVPYTEKWAKSWYIGISYNLSSLTSSSKTTVIVK